MNPLRVFGFPLPLVAIALWVEVYALVIQGATDACSFGYCALGHGFTVAAPHGLAALVGMLAVLLLAGALVLDRRLSRRMPAKPAPAWTHLPTTAFVIATGAGVLVIAALLGARRLVSRLWGNLVSEPIVDLPT